MSLAPEIRLMILDPAHFHAALVQKNMLPGVSSRSFIYAPLGQDLLEHLKRMERFNTRAANPTSWELDIHCTDDPVGRLCAERPGNVAVIAGRSANKMERIRACLNAGLHVLADKPWIIHWDQLAELEAALELADRAGLVAYDIMTERFEPTNLIQRSLVNDRQVFGAAEPGTETAPGVSIESVHHLLKLAGGVPNRRPAFYFDVREQGTSLADVGTHLIDLAQWTLFPDEAIEVGDLRIGEARRWPTPLTLLEFERLTGLSAFPPELAPFVKDGRLEFEGNGEIHYQLRGIHARVAALWNYESPAGVDFHYARFRGTRADIEVRQGEREKYMPEVYVRPHGDAASVGRAVEAHVERLQAQFAGVRCEKLADEFRIAIPDRYRVGHEAHFGQVLAEFLSYVRSPGSMPAWERPNMIAKYTVSTAGGAGDR